MSGSRKPKDMDALSVFCGALIWIFFLAAFARLGWAAAGWMVT